MKVRSLLLPWTGYSLSLLCLAIYLLPALSLPLSRGEAMYAQVPSEMLAAGRWIFTTLNGAPYLEKPPLLYWLNLLAFKVFGVSDWAARLPTLAMTMAEVWLTFRLGGLLMPPRAAWLGGFILLSSVGFFYLHLEIFTDHLITLTLLTALIAMLHWLKEPRGRWVCLFHLSLGAGYLSKGIIGLGFPLVIGGLYGWHLRQPRLRRLFLHPGGLVILALMIVPWLAATERAHPGFLWHHFVNEHFLRFLGERQPGGVSTISMPLFWLFLTVWLLPWTLLLPGALYHFGKEAILDKAGRERSLLLIWPAVVLGIFTLSSTRIEYYSLPALPALALVLGWQVDRDLTAARGRALAWALLALGLLGLGATFFVPFLDQWCAGNRREFLGLLPLVAPMARRVSFTIPPLALLGGLLGLRRPRLALAGYAGLSLALLFFTYQALVALSPVRSDKSFGEYVRAHTRPGDRLVMEYIEEFELGASLAFYARRPILMVQRHGLPRFVYPVAPESNYLISPARLKELWQGPQRVFLLVDNALPSEPYLKDAQVALAGGGKRLLVNHSPEIR
jgi:4-amino-4-deoxy-L-arabinose transferase-like glycosyltransferase